ncbi:MAG: ABC-F family ATP-binding cassette domain-containing protein [Bacteroidetes bacterium]|jgi:ATP-binding cassette, subfamily F, member 3|nr:ABC-F family ATP-binding cassette domain-containing protein [Bacteroidota bacterium]MBT6686903.1 ABC-F family ATP-binding cassette domain-containing protein [Bacteroidota bacterium]MBT7144199.1 ABC-F family ATP-binding cassette domain-containing protein [Bacteroidota bacterium]MBT7491582.1 ABC-F family ATP-binding cassette domain-containing protein [Bacteroidota bacterium]
MISLNQISVFFGSFVLFKDISFLINQQDKIGLVGKNGAGKSTLLKLIIGEQTADNGKINFPNELKFGYLPQQMVIKDQRNVYDEIMSAFDEIIFIEKKIKTLNHDISSRTDYETEEYLDLIDSLSVANERFQILGGNSIQSKIEQTLLGLGFETSDFQRPTNEFSGGWRMRIELAKILISKPDSILLDEPTNHLDIESIQWLENFLIEYTGAVVLISHDRAFLDNVTKRTIEISLGKIYDYKVPYSKYLYLRDERQQQQIAAYRNQQKIIEDTEAFIKRFRYKASKAVQVQSRVKHLEKLDRIEIDEQDLSKIHFKFPPAPHSGNIIVETKGLSKNYGNLSVLKDIDFFIEKGEKIAFVGRNGEGKTTLSRIIMGELDHSGMCKIGHKVKIGYFAQNQDELLDEAKTVFETLDEIATGDIRTKTRNILGSFLFSGEDIEKKVKVLSGGERSRLALAKLLLEPVNLLVLDEPTNHLDLRSKDVLKKALQQFDGTIIIVSHDRDFLDGLVSKVYEFKNKKVKENIGGIYEFLQRKRIASLVELERKKAIKTKNIEQSISENKKSYKEKKELEKIIRKISNKISKSEAKISELESEIKEMDILLSDSEKISDNSLFSTYEEKKKELEIELGNWELYCQEQEEWENKR